jgi:hypothetical protein
MYTREHILAEIKRTAEENGGSPLGQARFYKETGIKQSDWLGKHWARWSNALQEAGYPPNQWQGAYATTFLMERLAELSREIGHFPAKAEIQLKTHRDGNFPSANVFQRLGTKAELAAKLYE